MHKPDMTSITNRIGLITVISISVFLGIDVTVKVITRINPTAYIEFKTIILTLIDIVVYNAEYVAFIGVIVILVLMIIGPRCKKKKTSTS